MSLLSLVKRAASAVVKVAKNHPTETKLIAGVVLAKVAPKPLKLLVPVLVAGHSLTAITTPSK